MNCNKTRELLDKYLRGEAAASQERAVHAHLEGCAACRRELDTRLADTESGGTAPGLTANRNGEGAALSDEQQRRIFRRAKWKNRLGTAVFLLALFLVFQIAGTMLSSLYFNWGGENARLYKAQRTAAVLTDLTFPNVTMAAGTHPLPPLTHAAGWGHSSVEVKPYFAARGSYALQKRVGKEEYTVGHLQVNHLFGLRTTNWNWRDGAHDHYLRFYHPEQVVAMAGAGILPEFAVEETWHALEVLPEGTVAELAVSFRETRSVAQVMAILSDYDLEVAWYAVSTGLEGESGPGDAHQRPLAAFSGAWGVPGHSPHMFTGRGQEGGSTGRGGTVTGVSVVQHTELTNLPGDETIREQYLMDSMRFLAANERLAAKIYRGDSRWLRLPERYAYLQENGVQVYGVVVTGPTKELLRLRELETVHSPALGEVRLWNWFNRDFSGTLY